MDKVWIEVDSKWVRVVRSPMYLIVVALQGVSISIAPLFLYWSGTGRFHWIAAPLSYAVIFLVGLFYLRLGNAVVAELRKKQI